MLSINFIFVIQHENFFLFRKMVALFTPALIGVAPLFKTDVIRVGAKGAGLKKGPDEKWPIEGQ